MPNQIPFNYYGSNPISDYTEINNPYNKNESNLLYELNEIKQKLINIEKKLNELTTQKNTNFDYNYKTSMHMM